MQDLLIVKIIHDDAKLMSALLCFESFRGMAAMGFINVVRDVQDASLVLLWTLVRLDSLGNGLLLLELSFLTFGGSLRMAYRNSILFIHRVISAKERKKRSNMQ